MSSEISTSTFEKSNLVDLMADASEFGLDQLIENEAIKDIPIIGGVVKCLKLSSNISDFLYAKKLSKFLAKISETSNEQRVKFAREISDNPNRLYENILLLLDKTDDMQKSVWFGQIISHAIIGNLKVDEALRLCAMISKCYSIDLHFLSNSESGLGIPVDIAESLTSIGFLQRSFIDDPFLSVQTREIYQLNDWGRKIINLLQLQT